jgi:hypothetical protein
MESEHGGRGGHVKKQTCVKLQNKVQEKYAFLFLCNVYSHYGGRD